MSAKGKEDWKGSCESVIIFFRCCQLGEQVQNGPQEDRNKEN